MAQQNKITKSSIYLPAASHRRILERTTDLAAISGCKVLVLLDEQNLSITAKSSGYELQYGLLAERIHVVAESDELHIFTAVESYDDETRQQFENMGYIAHTKIIRRKCFGQHCDPNIDNLFAFWAGVYSLRTNWDVIVFGSGDYGLSGELSQAVRGQRRRRQIQIMTLSLPGSTSQDLDACRNQNIAANLEIGLDLLKPSVHTRCQLTAAAASSFGKFRFGNFINHLF